MRLGRAVAAVVLPVVLSLGAACTTTQAEQATDPSSGSTAESPAASGAASPSAEDPAGTGKGGGKDGRHASPVAEPADPEHAVDPPGPREGALALADVLVYATHTLSDETVRRIEHLEGVTRVEPMAMAQSVIENKALTVAAVDPGTYRNFTPYGSAEAQEVWDRVAGGELALRPNLKKKLPLTDDGYLRLGSEKDAPAVHVGAFAPQTPEIDAVVNPAWIDTLDMEPDNALLITTGRTSPESLRKPLERIAGDEASVQLTDVVAREGLDPQGRLTAVLVGSVADAVGVFNYTAIGGGRIAPDPAWVRSHIATEEVPILGTVTCNKLIFPQLRAALEEIISRGLAAKIHPGEYAGCYYPRFIAGTTSLSNHSFGLALDLNTPGNQRGTVGQMDRTVVSIFKRWGFAWGGDWHYTDPMHFEMNALVEPH